jgi:hypothetical protein
MPSSLSAVYSEVITICSELRGKWTYWCPARYKAVENKSGQMRWKKVCTYAGASTQAKAERMAREIAARNLLSFEYNIRHNRVVD